MMTCNTGLSINGIKFIGHLPKQTILSDIALATNNKHWMKYKSEVIWYDIDGLVQERHNSIAEV